MNQRHISLLSALLGSLLGGASIANDTMTDAMGLMAECAALRNSDVERAKPCKNFKFSHGTFTTANPPVVLAGDDCVVVKSTGGSVPNGQYTVIFKKSFDGQPTVVVSAAKSTPGGAASLVSVSATGFVVNVSGSPSEINFIAMTCKD